METLKTHLNAALDQSRMYFSAEALPAAGDIQRLVRSKSAAAFESGLTAVEWFFVFELEPAVAEQPGAPVGDAYCAALELLPSDWWGLPGRHSTTASRHLRQVIDRTAACLLQLLESDTPLHFHSGEENALARAHGLTLADTSAAFLADALGEPYDWRAVYAERQKVRARLRQLYTDPRRRASAGNPARD